MTGVLEFVRVGKILIFRLLLILNIFIMSAIQNVEFYLRRMLSCGAVTVEELERLVAKLSGKKVSAAETVSEGDDVSWRDVQVGWYAFAGGKFSSEPEAYPNRQGVVGWVNPDKNAPVGHRGLIVTPDEFCARWSDGTCAVGVENLSDGKSNTAKLLAYAKEHGIEFPAAEWCAEYDRNGIQLREGFLPAKEQLELIVAHTPIVNQALERIYGCPLGSIVWSSSECDGSHACAVRYSDGKVSGCPKNKHYFVRCIVVF